MRDKTAKLALLVASVVLTLYALEVALIFVGRSRPPADITPQDAFGDRRPLLDVVRDLRDEGVEAYPIILPRSVMAYAKETGEDPAVFPLASISNVRTVDCKRRDNGEYVIYESDIHGFNNPAKSWAEPKLDMALIGDSFTHGYCVEREESVAGHLRGLGHSALALAMSMNGPLTELATLMEFGPALKPGAVLWLYYEGNDLRNLYVEEKFDALLAYLDPGFSQGLIERQAEVDRTLVDYEAERMAASEDAMAGLEDAEPGTPAQELRRESGVWSKLASIATMSRIRNRLGPRPRRDSRPIASPEQLRDILVRAQEVVEGWDGQLVFVYLTHRNRHIPRGNINVDQLRQRETVLSLVGELGIPIIDTEGAFSSHPDAESLFEPINRVREADGTTRRGIHYSPDGYRVIAEAIRAHLYSEGRP